MTRTLKKNVFSCLCQIAKAGTTKDVEWKGRYGGQNRNASSQMAILPTSNEPMIPAALFKKLSKDILDRLHKERRSPNYKDELHSGRSEKENDQPISLSEEGSRTLHQAAEEYLNSMLVRACMATLHAKRITTTVADLRFVIQLDQMSTGPWYQGLDESMRVQLPILSGDLAQSVNFLIAMMSLGGSVDELQMLGQILGVKGAPMALAKRLKDKGLKVKIDGPVDVNGGTSHFLKRKFESIEKGLVITQDVKYAERLVGLLELEKANVKRTPMPQQVPEPGVGERLDAEMHALYRKCIGLLLYMSSERPDLQYGVKVLSSRCSDPTQTDFNLLRHLVKYVKLHPVVPVKMERCNPGRTVFQKWEGRDCEPEDWDPKKYPFGRDHIVEVVTDADWGSKVFPERRSISAYVILINGNVCHCGNKVQKTISLSSAESELMASLLGVTEAMFVGEMVRFICGPNSRVKLVHYVDNSAARSIIQKQGLQRTRHVSLAWLWIQRSHHDGVFVTKPISTRDAPADLQTKSHGRNRLKYLMSLIGMSLDEDDDAGPVRVQRVRARATTVQGSSIAAVMRALAVILEGGEALSFDQERDFRSVHVPIIVAVMIVLGLIGAWSVASAFIEEGGTLTMWLMLFVLMASVGATEIVADDTDDGAANFLQRLCDHSGLAALVIALCMLVVVIYMPPRRWNRDRGRGSAQQQPFEPRDGCMTYDDYIHENLFDTWDEVFPRSDDDEGGAAEAYVQSYVHEGDDGEVEEAAQGEIQGYVRNDRGGEPQNFDVENQDQDQMPHEPHADMVYIVGEAKRKKGFHKRSCGHQCSGGVTELRWALLLIPIGAAPVGPEIQLLDLSDCKQAFFLVGFRLLAISRGGVPGWLHFVHILFAALLLEFERSRLVRNLDSALLQADLLGIPGLGCSQGRRQWSDRHSDAQRALLRMVSFADCFLLLAVDRAGVPGWVHLGYVLNKANMKDAICQLLQTKPEQGAAAFLRCLQMFKAAVSKQAPLATLGNQIVDGDVLEDCISAVRAGCDFPLPPPLLEGGREDSELIAAAVAEPSPEVSDALEMFFLRLEPDYLTVVKVQPTAERNVDGYQHLLCVKDVWSQLSMATSFLAWYSKNESSGTLKQHADSWGLSRKHIVRHESYKGSQEAFTWPGLRYDCVSSAGFLLLIGTLAQIRGLAENVQTRCVSLLRRMTGLLEFSDGLKLLPTLTLAVQDGQAMLKSFLKLFDCELRASLKQRWENCVALGTSRKNLGGYPVADVCWFLMRLRADSDGLLHILAQAWETGMCEGSIHLRDTPPRQQEEPGQTPWSSGSRTRNANLARQELLNKFLARGGGFVTGLRNRSNSEICPTDLELPGTLGKSLGACAAHQFLTGYFLDARSALMKKLSVQKFRHMSMYEDAAKVGTYEVLQVLVSADGLMISSPISLLPQLKETTESSAAENLAKAAELVPKKALQDLKGAKASCGPATLRAPEKVATRSKLLGINHSLNALIDYRLADSLPPHAFRPCRDGERRSTVHWNGLDLPYVWSPKGVTWQTTQYPGWQSILRLNCLQDEGDAAGVYQMAQNGLAVLVHRDTLHKLHREEILASSEVAEIALARKQINLVLKYDRAPWATSAFGRRLAEARERVGEIPTDHPLIDMVSAGIISDLGLSPDASPAQVKEAILAFCRSKRGSTGAEHKTGRWCDLLDSFRRLRSEWHCRLFVLLFAMILEGRNPWSALSESLDKAGSDDDLALAPKVLGDPWLRS
ncbi:unnamed protein product [Symbiodinium sp. CCMP2592]|nr:unnamed protein product [Symbiodinium sp. CCMP2592]